MSCGNLHSPVDYHSPTSGAGTPGADGYTPIKGVDYFDGIDGLNGTNSTVPGPKGDKGDRGDQGIQGEPGAPGGGSSSLFNFKFESGRLKAWDLSGRPTILIPDGKRFWVDDVTGEVQIL